MTEDMPYKDELRRSLLGAAERRARRRRRLQRSGMTIAGVVMILTLSVAMLQSRPEPSAANVLKIEQTGTEVRVTLEELTATPEQIQEELRAAGINASVQAVPMPPSAVGHFVSVMMGPGYPMTPDGTSFRSFVIADAPEYIEVHFGRLAAPGERYAKAIDAFGPGEPLHCTGLRGQAVSEVAKELNDRGFKTSWQRYTSNGFVASTVEAEENFVVNRVLHTAEREFLVYTTPPGVEPFVGVEQVNDCS